MCVGRVVYVCSMINLIYIVLTLMLVLRSRLAPLKTLNKCRYNHERSSCTPAKQGFVCVNLPPFLGQNNDKIKVKNTPYFEISMITFS